MCTIILMVYHKFYHNWNNNDKNWCKILEFIFKWNVIITVKIKWNRERERERYPGEDKKERKKNEWQTKRAKFLKENLPRRFEAVSTSMVPGLRYAKFAHPCNFQITCLLFVFNNNNRTISMIVVELGFDVCNFVPLPYIFRETPRKGHWLIHVICISLQAVNKVKAR